MKKKCGLRPNMDDSTLFFIFPTMTSFLTYCKCHLNWHKIIFSTKKEGKVWESNILYFPLRNLKLIFVSPVTTPHSPHLLINQFCFVRILPNLRQSDGAVKPEDYHRGQIIRYKAVRPSVLISKLGD